MAPKRPCNGEVKDMVVDLSDEELDKILDDPVVKAALIARKTENHTA